VAKFGKYGGNAQLPRMIGGQFGSIFAVQPSVAKPFQALRNGHWFL